jgi:hypothetical protein
MYLELHFLNNRYFIFHFFIFNFSFVGHMLFQVLVLSVYLFPLLCIVLYSFGQLHLVILFLKNRRKTKPEPPLEGNDVPFVTIQLPIYNERYVVERLLEACAAQDYPKDRFEIQLLDDSDDETVELAAAKIAELQGQGYQVSHVRRPVREGFKAGALAYGLKEVKGDFIAIFDADFLPVPMHLRTAMAQFTAANIGVVQARWEHVNQHYSLFTEMQAFHLDAHFTVEQFGRNSGDMCINFNGTAGLWRKETIIDAGNWQADTLTEDLDLSYRAQLRGWKFRYIDKLGAPAELPAEMGAIKSQQYRWMKGGGRGGTQNDGPTLAFESCFWTKNSRLIAPAEQLGFFVGPAIGRMLCSPTVLKTCPFRRKDGFFDTPCCLAYGELYKPALILLGHHASPRGQSG